MKKIILSLVPLFIILTVLAQDPPPGIPTAISPNFTWYRKITTGDTAYYGYSNNNWVNFARRSWVNSLFLKMADSTRYITPYYFSRHSSASSVTVGNGITKTGDTITFGGLLTKSVRLNNTQATFVISADQAPYGALQAIYYPDGFTFNIGQSSDPAYSTSSFSMYNYGGGFRVGNLGLSLSPYGFIISNGTHLNGIRYNDKQNFISDRSIPDKAWIDSAISAHAFSGTSGAAPVFVTRSNYAAMLADGIPAVATFYEIVADENKNYARSTYLWKPSGRREWIASTPDN